jgi:hypothetical protein
MTEIVMSDCVRCGQPIKAGQFFLHAEYLPTDIQDLLRQPDPEGGGWLVKSPYRIHVSCPTAIPAIPAASDVEKAAKTIIDVWRATGSFPESYDLVWRAKEFLYDFAEQIRKSSS